MILLVLSSKFWLVILCLELKFLTLVRRKNRKCFRGQRKVSVQVTSNTQSLPLANSILLFPFFYYIIHFLKLIYIVRTLRTPVGVNGAEHSHLGPYPCPMHGPGPHFSSTQGHQSPSQADAPACPCTQGDAQWTGLGDAPSCPQPALLPGSGTTMRTLHCSHFSAWGSRWPHCTLASIIS